MSLIRQNRWCKNQINQFLFINCKKKKNSKFIFFVPINLNLKEFKKNFSTPNVIFHKIDIYSNDIIKRFLLGLFFWPIMFKKYDLDYFDQSYLPLFIFLKEKQK